MNIQITTSAFLVIFKNNKKNGFNLIFFFSVIIYFLVYEINLENCLNNNKNSINKIDCFDCKKKQEKENDFLNFFIEFTFKQVIYNKKCYF